MALQRVRQRSGARCELAACWQSCGGEVGTSGGGGTLALHQHTHALRLAFQPTPNMVGACHHVYGQNGTRALPLDDRALLCLPENECAGLNSCICWVFPPAPAGKVERVRFSMTAPACCYH